MLEAGTPTDIRTQIELTTYRNYQGLVEALNQFAQSRTHLATIGAFHQQHGGKSKGKGKGKGKGKHKSMDKGKGKDKAHSDASLARFQGHCNHCGKFGHKKSECRFLARQGPTPESASAVTTYQGAEAAPQAAPTVGATDAVIPQVSDVMKDG